MSRVRAATRLARLWLRPAPPERLAAVRVLVGLFATLYVVARLPHFASFEGFSGFRPVGVVNLIEAPLPAGACWAIALLCAASGAAFTLGWRFWLSGPLFAATLLWVTSYASSWGMIFHTDNLLVLQVIALAAGRSADAYALDPRPEPDEELEDPQEPYGWPLRLMAAITVATYLIAGVAKLRVSGLEWATAEVLRSNIAYDALRKAALGSTHSPLGPWLAGFDAVWVPLGLLTLALEVGAPIALFGRRLAWAWCITAWLFHVGVLATMAIGFVYPLTFVAFACFFETEHLAAAALARWRAWRGHEAQSVGAAGK